MKILSLVLLSLFVVVQSYAYDIATAVVKTESTRLDQTVDYKGSGLAFTYNDQMYVVTSDHVVIHDNKDNHHSITFSNGSTYPAEYLLSDYGRGLALLKVTMSTGSPTVPKLDTLPSVLAKLSDKAVMLGFPAMSQGIVKDKTGSIEDPDQSSGLFVQVLKLIKVSKGHAEFGMSGGVLSNTAGEFLGILSHQVYSEDPSGVQNTIYVIPAGLVTDWLKQYFANPVPVPQFINFVQSSDQLADKEGAGFLTGHLYFVYASPFGDGSYYYSFAYDSRSPSTIYGQKTGDLQKYSDFLKAHDDCQGYLLGFRKRGVVGWGSQLKFWSEVRAGSVSTLRDLDEPTLEPVIRLWCNDTIPEVDKLKAHYESLKSLVNRMSDKNLRLIETVNRYLENYVRYQDSDDDKNNTYYMLKPSDIQKLETDPAFASDWQSLDTDFAKQLRKELDSLAETLTHLTI